MTKGSSTRQGSQALEELVQYQHAAVAMQLAHQHQQSGGKEGSLEMVSEALKKYLTDRGEIKTDAADMVMDMCHDKESGRPNGNLIAAATNAYQKYTSRLEKLTASELYAHYSRAVPESVDENVQALFAQYGAETYEKIEMKVKHAEHKLAGLEVGETLSDKDKAKYERQLKEYGELYKVIQTLESMKIKRLMGKIETKVLSQNVKAVAAKRVEELAKAA